jgi:hypothetical protein
MTQPDDRSGTNGPVSFGLCAACGTAYVSVSHLGPGYVAHGLLPINALGSADPREQEVAMSDRCRAYPTQSGSSPRPETQTKHLDRR